MKNWIAWRDEIRLLHGEEVAGIGDSHHAAVLDLARNAAGERDSERIAPLTEQHQRG